MSVAAASSVEPTVGAFDVERVRADFPALHQDVRGKPLVYLDSAATALKPQAVVDAVVQAYTQDTANVHRGVHLLSQRATDRVEAAREDVRRWINAKSVSEVVWVRGTTEGVNLVAQAYARPRLGPGDEIVVTGLEHHSNFVPWQQVCAQTGARLVVVPVENGTVSAEALDRSLSSKTRLVALSHVSNALGSVLPVKQMVTAAHERGAVVVVDGAQAVPHLRVDVSDLGCDFYAFSGHKLYGPTGIGVLYGKLGLLEEMDPWQGGGEMITTVSVEKTTYKEPPFKFEAGTPDIAGAFGMGAAVRYLESLDLDAAHEHERQVLERGRRRLSDIPGVTVWGPSDGSSVAVLSFTIEGVHPHDVGTIADMHGVALRTGHHCAEPLMHHLGLPGTTRASLGLYTTHREIDALIDAVLEAKELLGPCPT